LLYHKNTSWLGYHPAGDLFFSSKITLYQGAFRFNQIFYRQIRDGVRTLMIVGLSDFFSLGNMVI